MVVNSQCSWGLSGFLSSWTNWFMYIVPILYTKEPTTRIRVIRERLVDHYGVNGKGRPSGGTRKKHVPSVKNKFFSSIHIV